MKTKIVVLSFNHEGITTKCVESALRFFDSKDIILVHNGSRENSVRTLKEAFSSLTHLESQNNAGFSGGANRGINFAFSKSDCGQVLFLSNDTQLTKFDNPKFETTKYLVAPVVELRNTRLTHSFGAKVRLDKGELKHLGLESHIPQRGFYIPGSAFLISKDAWFKLGGFDESLGSYWEDVDLSLRAKQVGVNLLRTTEIKVKHSVGKTTGGDPFYTVFLFHRNRKRVSLRHGLTMERISFILIYGVSIFRKLFKYLINKDFKRLKLLLKAAVSC